MVLRPERIEVRERPLLCSRCRRRVNRKYRGKIVVDPEFVKAYRRYKGLTEPGRLEYLKELGARQAANRKAGWAAMTPEARAAFMARLHAGRDAYWERERARKDALRRKLAEEPDTSSRPVRKTGSE